MKSEQKPLVAAVVGPTATGKTWFGVELALALNAEVISCDSMQIYRGMEIGTAAPTLEERRGVPHHMVGILSPTKTYSVADYCRDAAACIKDIVGRGKLPILVGGTGLYLDSLLNGLSYPTLPDAGPLRAQLLAQAAQEGSQALHARLREVDPICAARLHENDTKRIVRALEVFESTGRTMTELGNEARRDPPYRAVRFGLDYQNRAALYERIDRRVDLMIEQGLLEEVRALAALPGVAGPRLPPSATRNCCRCCAGKPRCRRRRKPSNRRRAAMPNASEPGFTEMRKPNGFIETAKTKKPFFSR